MKAKNIFALLGLSFAVGIGVAAGVTFNPAKEARAADVTLYFKDQSWWSADSGATGAYYWNGSGVAHDWPGVRMSKVATDTGVWKIEIPDTYNKIIFTRVNPTGSIAYWNAKTVDLDIPTDGKNLFTLSTTAVWGDPGASGEWSEYEEPAPVDPTTVKYYAKIGGGSYTEMTYDSSFVYDETKTGYKFVLEDVDASAGHSVLFKKEADAIEPGASSIRETHQNNMVWKSGTPSQIKVLTDVTDQDLELYVYEDGYDSFMTGFVSNEHTYYFTNNQGWVGTPKVYLFDILDNAKSEWPGDNMTFVDYDGDNNARYTFTADTNRWYRFIIVNQAGDDQTVNLAFASYAKDGFYLNARDAEQDNKWTVGVYDYAAPVRSMYVGGVEYTLTKSVGALDEGVLVQYETESIDLTAGDQLRYKVDNSYKGFDLQGYGRNNCYYDTTLEYNRVLATASGKVYVKIMSDFTTKVFVMGIDSVSAGYHVFLNDEEVIELVDSGEIPEGYTGQTCSGSVTFHTGDKFRLLDTSSSVALPAPFSAAHFDEYSDEHFIKDGNYIKYTGTGNYDASIYLKLKSGDDMVYVGKADPAVAAAKEYAIAFNSAIGAICKWDGSTNQSQLETAWATQATNFKALAAEVQTEVKKGSTSTVLEVQQFAAKYDSVYTLRKVGSGWDLENFLNKSYSSGLAQQNALAAIVDNGALIAIVCVVALASISAVAVLVVKRRKHN